jgi:hypothetical protein
MYYGSLLNNKVLLQDSLLSLRAETIKTLLNNNTKILLQKDSLLRVIEAKNEKINAMANKNNKYRKKVRSKNASIGFLIIIVVLSVLL